MKIRIVNVTDGGNNLYVDDLNIGDGSDGNPTAVTPPPTNDCSRTFASRPTGQWVASCSGQHLASRPPFDATLFDAAGRAVQTWQDRSLETGSLAAVLPVGNLPGGIYFLRVKNVHGTKTIKLIW